RLAAWRRASSAGRGNRPRRLRATAPRDHRTPPPNPRASASSTAPPPLCDSPFQPSQELFHLVPFMVQRHWAEVAGMWRKLFHCHMAAQKLNLTDVWSSRAGKAELARPNNGELRVPTKFLALTRLKTLKPSRHRRKAPQESCRWSFHLSPKT